MVCLPDGEKNFEDIFIRFDATHERDRRTDTACRHIPRLCIASRGKNFHRSLTFFVRVEMTHLKVKRQKNTLLR